ncbi:PhzF family phenazine biosynthesis protein [Chitinibacter sp. S2-10]|uniref:PhzF family phenazine biosynthesis protein n=1 Tax=Chitinibacter sp. S2-10 TaxID=3373597 RepID=UPI003977AB0F
MTTLTYQLFNVFATDDIWSGNPLAVFSPAQALDDETMQRLAQQMNLSEITFVSPCVVADAQVRIFSPSYELPFAGHPTLGTAFAVANQQKNTCATEEKTTVTLAMKAGMIPVAVDGEMVTLSANVPTYRAAPANVELAKALNLQPEQIHGTPRFVNTGSEQLIIPLVDAESVAQCSLNLDVFARVAANLEGRSGALVWARQGDTVIARYFWSQHGQAAEDFGTGSACANLGGWLLAENVALPLTLEMEQGHAIDRIARLHLSINADRQIQVGGKVRRVGEGTFDL